MNQKVVRTPVDGLHTKVSFVKLNDIYHIGNGSPSCHLTIQSHQYKQNKMQNFLKVNNKASQTQSWTWLCVFSVNVKHI